MINPRKLVFINNLKKTSGDDSYIEVYEKSDYQIQVELLLDDAIEYFGEFTSAIIFNYNGLDVSFKIGCLNVHKIDVCQNNSLEYIVKNICNLEKPPGCIKAFMEAK